MGGGGSHTFLQGRYRPLFPFHPPTYLPSSPYTHHKKNSYEQDWLYNELQGVSAILYNVTLGKQWLIEMGAGAETAGVSIQCVTFLRPPLFALLHQFLSLTL